MTELRKAFRLRTSANTAVLLGQVIVDIAHGAVQLTAADAARTGVARQIGGKPVHLRRHTGKPRNAAHMLRPPVRHEALDVDAVLRHGPQSELTVTATVSRNRSSAPPT